MLPRGRGSLQAWAGGGSSMYLCLKMDKRFDSVAHACLLGLMSPQGGRRRVSVGDTHRGKCIPNQRG